jgi:hypothetical protein
MLRLVLLVLYLTASFSLSQTDGGGGMDPLGLDTLDRGSGWDPAG